MHRANLFAASLLLTLSAFSVWAWQRSHRSFAAIPAGAYASVSAANGVRDIDWSMLRSGQVVEPGGEVRIPGFVVPLEVEEGATGEFLLVPSRACVHTPPPDTNQIVLVKHSVAKINAGRPVWVYGKLKVAKTASRNGRAAYEIQSTHVEPYEN